MYKRLNVGMKFEKENQMVPVLKHKSFSDPRTWGPYEEYTKALLRSTGADAADKAAGLDKLKYKYVIPTGLRTSYTGAPDTSIQYIKPRTDCQAYGGPGICRL
jgi:hypothetical protein